MFGTLCGIDREPADLSSKFTTTLAHFAKLVSSQMQLEESRIALDRSLVEERRIGKLREEFIAILGHDLRNPLNGISTNVDLLHEMRDEPPLPTALDGLRGSVDQMSQLIEQTMDFARTRLGHGVVLNRESVADLVELARACAQELSSSGPSSRFEIRADRAFSAKVDPVRLRQIFSNLMGNAVAHGASNRPVIVGFTETAGNIRVTFHNEGKPIADEMMAVLFEPFHRSSSRGSRQGLGLGLYIAFQTDESARWKSFGHFRCYWGHFHRSPSGQYLTCVLRQIEIGQTILEMPRRKSRGSVFFGFSAKLSFNKTVWSGASDLGLS